MLIDVNAHIPAGQQVAMVGETGSGKTTLGRLVARLADPTAGVVKIGGVSLTQVSNAELRTRLVVVPQEPFLFEGTIAANLGFARPALSLAQVEQAVIDLDLGDWLESLPEGLDTEVGQRGSSLSAGERQLVALVRASLVDPDVLVLDEATSSVDALTEVRLTRALDKLAGRADDDLDRAPAVDGGPSRPGAGARTRTPGAGRCTHRPRRRRRPVRPHVRGVGGCHQQHLTHVDPDAVAAGRDPDASQPVVTAGKRRHDRLRSSLGPEVRSDEVDQVTGAAQ